MLPTETKVKLRGQKKRPGQYRHGDLAQALLDAAAALVAQRRGPHFSLREIADLLGVSHPAVYRHYESRDMLVSALAIRSFSHLLTRLTEIKHEAKGDFHRWIDGIAALYIETAQKEPGAYRVMFTASSLVDEVRDKAAQACFGELLACCEQGQAQGTVRKDMSAYEIAASMWAGLHGIASLIMERCLPDERGSEHLPLTVLALQKVMREGWRN